MDLELISFKLCPFVQRAVITLLYKEVPHRITYIDLSAPPPWFLDISPFGKVPLLRVDGEHVLFESAVINEFVDEVTPNRLMPEEPVRRALNRAWIEFGSACLGDHFRLTTAENQGQFDNAQSDLQDKFERLEGVLGDGPYFNGADFSLVDSSFAPLFMRLEMLNQRVEIYDRAEFPKVAAWSEALLALPAVRGSVVEDFEPLFLEHVAKRSAYMKEQLGVA